MELCALRLYGEGSPAVGLDELDHLVGGVVAGGGGDGGAVAGRAASSRDVAAPIPRLPGARGAVGLVMAFMCPQVSGDALPNLSERSAPVKKATAMGKLRAATGWSRGVVGDRCRP